MLEWIVYCHLTKLFHCEALAQFVSQNKTYLITQATRNNTHPWTNQRFNIRDGWTSVSLWFWEILKTYFAGLTWLNGSVIYFSCVLKAMHCRFFSSLKNIFKYLYQNFPLLETPWKQKWEYLISSRTMSVRDYPSCLLLFPHSFPVLALLCPFSSTLLPSHYALLLPFSTSLFLMDHFSFFPNKCVLKRKPKGM